MRYDELTQILCESTPDDWITDIYTEPRPEYVAQRNMRGDITDVEISSHQNLAIYGADICLSIAAGMPVESDWEPPFNREMFRSPDEPIRPVYVDVLWSRAPVLRVQAAIVDGYAALLPIPMGWPDYEHEAPGFVPRRESNVCRIVSELFHGGDYDRYLDATWIEER